jgi:membrane protease subunit HflK
VLILSSVYQIGAEEVGVITRFGRYVRTQDPGLNVKWPFVETLYKVAVERQQKLEFGFRTDEPGVNTTYIRNASTTVESLMLTGDLNLADVEWVVQYRISNAYEFLFKVRDVEGTLRDMAESAMRQIVGDRSVNEVLTIGRTEIESTMEAALQDLCTKYGMGVKIEQVVLQDVNPPDEVKSAFNMVNQAQQEKETLINQARSEYNKVIPKASGEAQEILQKAHGYATERVNLAKGDVARFSSLYKEYLKAPDVTKKRLYLETMSKVMPKLGQVVITDEEGNSVLPLLQMEHKSSN